MALISAPLFWRIIIIGLRVLAATEPVKSAAIATAADGIITEQGDSHPFLDPALAAQLPRPARIIDNRMGVDLEPGCPQPASAVHTANKGRREGTPAPVQLRPALSARSGRCAALV